MSGEEEKNGGVGGEQIAKREYETRTNLKAHGKMNERTIGLYT